MTLLDIFGSEIDNSFKYFRPTPIKPVLEPFETTVELCYHAHCNNNTPFLLYFMNQDRQSMKLSQSLSGLGKEDVNLTKYMHLDSKTIQHEDSFNETMYRFFCSNVPSLSDTNIKFVLAREKNDTKRDRELLFAKFNSSQSPFLRFNPSPPSTDNFNAAYIGEHHSSNIMNSSIMIFLSQLHQLPSTTRRHLKEDIINVDQKKRKYNITSGRYQFNTKLVDKKLQQTDIENLQPTHSFIDEWSELSHSKNFPSINQLSFRNWLKEIKKKWKIQKSILQVRTLFETN